MPFEDLNDFIEASIRRQLETALAPYLDTLRRMNGMYSALAKVFEGARETLPRASLVPGAVPVRRVLKTRAQRGDASRFKIGERVRFHVGRGTYEGKVVRLELETGSVLVTRPGDPKLHKRPANAVTPLHGSVDVRVGSSRHGKLLSISDQPMTERRRGKMKLRHPAERGDASKFKQGERVRFKVARNTFAQGVVTQTDPKTNTVTIRREGSSVYFKRPAINVQTA